MDGDFCKKRLETMDNRPLTMDYFYVATPVVHGYAYSGYRARASYFVQAFIHPLHPALFYLYLCIYDYKQISYKMQLSNFIDPRDGQSYQTVIIGTQEWFTENLAYEVEGKLEKDVQKWSAKPYENWCYFGNDKSGAKRKKYGILYQMEAAKLAIPDSWRIPTLEDWNELMRYVALHYCDNMPPRNPSSNKRNWDQVGKVLRSRNFPFKAKGSGRRIASFPPPDFAPNGFANGKRRGDGYYWVWDQAQQWGKMTISFGTHVAYYFGQNTGHGYSIRCVRPT